MPKIIQVEIPDNLFEEIGDAISEDGFIDEPEFVRNCIRQYLNKRPLKSRKSKVDVPPLEYAVSDTKIKEQRTKIKLLKEIIRSLQDEYKSAVPIEVIISKAEEWGTKKNTVEKMIQKLKSEGEIIEASNERFRVVDVTLEDAIPDTNIEEMRAKIMFLKEIIRSLQDEYKSAVPIEDILSKTEESGVKKDTVIDVLQKLKHVGEIIEISNGKFRLC